MNNVHDVLVSENFSCEPLPVDGKKNVLYSVLFASYLGLSLVRFSWPAQLINTIALMGIGLISLVLMTVKLNRRHVSSYIFVYSLIFSVLASSLFVGRAERVEHSIIFALAGTGVALLILKKKVSSWAVYLVFYGISSYFFCLMLLGADARYVLSACSYNGISMMMLVSCISLYAISGLQNKNIDVFPAICTSIICVWAIGRSGILASLILLFGIILQKKWNFNFRTIFISVITLLFSGIILLFNKDILFSFTDFIGKNAIENYFLRSGQEEPRFMFWQNYFHNLDLPHIVFGSNILDDYWPEGSIFDYNYHNTWVNLHAQTGLMSLLIFSLLFFALFAYLKTNRLFFTLLLALIARWSSDIGLFFESWDFLIYFFIFHFLSLRFYWRIN